ncbi:hypothetical protein ACHWQZ_G004555 [Mnemiopsis leidyi]
MAEQFFLTRGSEGLKKYSYPNCEIVKSVFDTPKRCSGVCMSNNGKYIAVCNGSETIVYDVEENKIVTTLARSRTMLMAFSPKNTHLVTWRQYQVSEEFPENTPNVEIWRLDAEPQQEKPAYGYVKRGQSLWEPLWSEDEKTCARACNAEVQFFEDNDFSKVAKRIQRDKVGGVFVAPGGEPYHVALYVPSIKGAHAFVQLYLYGSFEKTAAVAHRSFMKVDNLNIKFNKSGKCGIIIAANDVDKTGSSYYGQTLLYFISIRGESNQIVLKKNGPVYSVEWNPAKDEFIVLYGFMPCKATLFNVKCDPIHEFGENHYNEILFNPQGNMVGLCGFGNLRGKIKFYDMDSKKLLSDFVAPDTTYFEWAPSGDVFITGTLSPRLRQDNEFKLWDVCGKTLHHWRVPSDETQLWQLKWINSATLLPPPPVPRPATSKEIAASKPQAYRPPGSRGKPAAATRSLLPNVNDGVYKPGSDASRNQPSKQAMKNQRKRENKAKQNEEQNAKPEPTMQDLQSTIVDEKEKKIRNLKKKLNQIEKLKAQVSAGKALEKNQMDKIATENEIIEEIKRLEI